MNCFTQELVEALQLSIGRGDVVGATLNSVEKFVNLMEVGKGYFVHSILQEVNALCAKKTCAAAVIVHCNKGG